MNAHAPTWYVESFEGYTYGADDIAQDTDSEMEEIDYPDEEDAEKFNDNQCLHPPLPSFQDLRYSSSAIVYMHRSYLHGDNSTNPPARAVAPQLGREQLCCPICLDTINIEKTPSVYCSLRCGKVYHTRCADEYMHKQVRDPPLPPHRDGLFKCPWCRGNTVFLNVV